MAAHAESPGRTSSTAFLVPLLVGSAVALALGAYSGLHEPTGGTITTFGFSSMLTMKVWLTTGAFLLGLFQLATALRMYGRIGSGPAPGWLGTAHRVSGLLAVLLTLPVAFHCLWALGFSSFDTRTLVHSALGCVFYGALVAKLLSLRMRHLPAWAVPLFGGLTFTLLVALWLSSSLWFFTNVGFPDGSLSVT